MKKRKVADSVLWGLQAKKAFTLIELLAIIVILAIIAVITVQIILNVIENSKLGAAQDSSYGYKNAIESFYVSKLSENPSFKIEDGTYTTNDLKNMGLSVSGKVPKIEEIKRVTDSSWLYSSKIGDWWSMGSFSTSSAGSLEGRARCVNTSGYWTYDSGQYSNGVRPVITIVKH